MRAVVRWSFGVFVLSLLVAGVACGGSESPESAGPASGAAIATAPTTVDASVRVEPAATPGLSPVPPVVVAGVATTAELSASLDDWLWRLYDALSRMTGASNLGNCGSLCAIDFDFVRNAEGAQALCLRSVDATAFRAEPGFDPSEHEPLLSALQATCNIIASIDANNVVGNARAQAAHTAVEHFIPEEERY